MTSITVQILCSAEGVIEAVHDEETRPDRICAYVVELGEEQDPEYITALVLTVFRDAALWSRKNTVDKIW